MYYNCQSNVEKKPFLKAGTTKKLNVPQEKPFKCPIRKAIQNHVRKRSYSQKSHSNVPQEKPFKSSKRSYSNAPKEAIRMPKSHQNVIITCFNTFDRSFTLIHRSQNYISTKKQRTTKR